MTNGDNRSLPAGAGPNGWLAFAGILLFLNGMFSGLTAILDEKTITVGGTGDVTVWDFTAWGWIALITGAALVFTGIGLFLGNTAARMLAIVFTVLNALAQFGSITAFPLWSILVIALDVMILYQLVVRWQLDE